MTKRITKATFKSFLKRNAGNLEIRNVSHFDGMTDGVEQLENNGFRPLIEKTFRSIPECDLGLDGVWLTHHCRRQSLRRLPGRTRHRVLQLCRILHRKTRQLINRGPRAPPTPRQ